MVTTVARTFNRTILTGATSYRRGFFGGLILTIEVKAQEAYAKTFDLDIVPPPPHFTDEQKAQHWEEEKARVENYWVTIRTYYRDAEEDDMRSLMLAKQQGAGYAIQQDESTS